MLLGNGQNEKTVKEMHTPVKGKLLAIGLKREKLVINGNNTQVVYLICLAA